MPHSRTTDRELPATGADAMTEAGDARDPPWSVMGNWINAKDPGLLAVKRSIRAAVIMPTVFGLTHVLFSNPQVSLFGAFGSFSLLLLVDFPGRTRTRLLSYVALVLVGACFIAVGTVASTDKVAAVVAMAAVGFCVLFLGLVSPQVATASTAALLLFVLPVAVAQPAGAVGPRLLGWAFAAVFCVTACMLVWPTPWHDNLRRRLSATVSAVAGLAEAHLSGGSVAEAKTAMESEVGLLRRQLAGTPYPATGAAASALALTKLVGRVEWVAGNATLAGTRPSSLEIPPVRTIIETVAETLRRCAALICDRTGHPVDDPVRVRELQESTRRLARLVDSEIDFEVSTLIDLQGTGDDGVVAVGEADDAEQSGSTEQSGSIASSLDPGFQARVLGVTTAMVAAATLEAAGVPAGGDRGFGVTGEAPAIAVWRRLASHLSFRSVWFRNAVRGTAGLALAVTVVEVTAVEHGFWVVLGTLSVLRSNALGTGATALRAIGGTAVGFVVGAAIMIGVGAHVAALWALLPVAVLVSGVAPSMISFAAGQAGFTLVVVILFNIIEPIGWRVGLTRIEDVAIGCGVSVVVGLLFWPRGAMAALGRALADAFVASSGYLADAVDRLTSTSRRVDTAPGERASHSAYLRLDDAYRQFLSERGAKVIPVEDVANLFTGSNRIRLAAYTLDALPVPPVERGKTELESVSVAGAVLRDSYASSHRWYEEFAEVLSGRRGSLDPPPPYDETLHGTLHQAFEEARKGRRGDRLRCLLQMLWAEEILEAQRQVQTDLADSATLFARRRATELVG
ncbi:MAG: FUSC family protein [Acidimicrobiales bacterium]